MKSYHHVVNLTTWPPISTRPLHHPPGAAGKSQRSQRSGSGGRSGASSEHHVPRTARECCCWCWVNHGPSWLLMVENMVNLVNLDG